MKIDFLGEKTIEVKGGQTILSNVNLGFKLL